jgi:predicted nuclease with TOPRIM domain
MLEQNTEFNINDMPHSNHGMWEAYKTIYNENQRMAARLVELQEKHDNCSKENEMLHKKVEKKEKLIEYYINTLHITTIELSKLKEEQHSKNTITVDTLHRQLRHAEEINAELIQSTVDLTTKLETETAAVMDLTAKYHRQSARLDQAIERAIDLENILLQSNSYMDDTNDVNE